MYRCTEKVIKVQVYRTGYHSPVHHPEAQVPRVPVLKVLEGVGGDDDPRKIKLDIAVVAPIAKVLFV